MDLEADRTGLKLQLGHHVLLGKPFIDFVCCSPQGKREEKMRVNRVVFTVPSPSLGTWDT